MRIFFLLFVIKSVTQTAVTLSTEIYIIETNIILAFLVNSKIKKCPQLITFKSSLYRCISHQMFINYYFKKSDCHILHNKLATVFSLCNSKIFQKPLSHLHLNLALPGLNSTTWTSRIISGFYTMSTHKYSQVLPSVLIKTKNLSIS